MEDLLHFDWNHTVVLHEMGVPPIHTQPEMLAAAIENPKNKKSTHGALEKRLFVLHTALGNAEKRGITQGHELQTIQINLSDAISGSWENGTIPDVLNNLPWFVKALLP